MIHDGMFKDFQDKKVFEKAKEYAFAYIDGIDKMPVTPTTESQALLSNFDESLPDQSSTAIEVLDFIQQYGGPNTAAQIGGRYFGFVNGGVVPAALGVKWLSDVWDQNGGLYVMSPINAKLESVCESWLKEMFELPDSTIAGFVSGTSSANLCCLLAARYQLLLNQGWDVNQKGLFDAPKIRVIAHKQVHASIKKTLALLGLGIQQVEWIPSDDTGAYDDFDTICDLANKAGAWVHIDGAFGLWAGATQKLKHLTKGMQKADSWAVDGHKTLNTPYDSGIAMCKHPDAMITALQSNGEYIIYSDKRDPILYTQEMSKRSRSIELWATMKYLGRQGIEEMVNTLHERSVQLSKGLEDLGLTLLNEVVFNQVLVSYKDDQTTDAIISHIQNSGGAWVGGTTWLGKRAIRNSICSWATTEEDIAHLISLYKEALSQV